MENKNNFIIKDSEKAVIIKSLIAFGILLLGTFLLIGGMNIIGRSILQSPTRYVDLK